MSHTSVFYKELRVLVHPTETHFYARIEANGPAAPELIGWHRKVFPADIVVSELFERWASGREDPTTWPFAKPPAT